MGARGVLFVPNRATERIVAVIASFEHRAFSVGEVHALVPGLTRIIVGKIIVHKMRAGWLERCGRGMYRVGGVHIKTTLPHGLVAEAVWTVLFTDHERRFKRMPQIVAETEEYLDRPNIRLYHTVSPILSLWHRRGHLERTGNWGEYAYRLGSDVTERPLSSH